MRKYLKYLLLWCIYTVPLSVPSNASSIPECAVETIGTSIPNSSGTPSVVNSFDGLVISANFFDSGAIDPPHFDGQEYVSVCVHPPDQENVTKATITADIGLDNDTRIKAYPQFLIGTKFGNQFETSFRYYSNNDLPDAHKWPVRGSDLTDANNEFTFANLEYISQIKGVGLPAFTTNLPTINITLDLDEQNVIGAERDVMLESWFYDTSANSEVIGSNQATGHPIVNTLNNIVGIGHPNYPALDNTLLEMMVHVGSLSPNDISGAQRKPGQNQLTENYSGKDHDGDGIDDHFDVDSHLNANTNFDPNPGIYSSGIDDNNDGIDDADLLPVTIGDYQYSIWYGESFLAPIIIFSRETNASLQSNFDPLTPDMDLSTEGEILLPWDEFIEYTLNVIETDLQIRNQSELASGAQRTLLWIDPDDSGDNIFSKMRSSGGAISGIEFGVEPQVNAPSDLPYIAKINKFQVEIDGQILSLNDTQPPNITFGNIDTASNTTSISGTAEDNVAIDRIRLLIQDITTSQYWDGTAWTSSWSWFDPGVNNSWNYQMSLSNGNYAATAWTWDTSNNIGDVATLQFSVGLNDNTPPSVQIDNQETQPSGIVTISGMSEDNVAIDRNRILIKNNITNQYWDGSTWTGTWSWFSPEGTSSWTYDITLADGDYSTLAWTWDTSNNLGNIASASFSVGDTDTMPPTITLDPTESIAAGPVTISGTSEDNTAIDRNRLLIRDTNTGLFWGGTAWTNTWSWFAPVGKNNWVYTLVLPTGYFSVTAWTWDSSNNIGNISSMVISIGDTDTTDPTVNITSPGSPPPGSITLQGTSSDNIAIERNRLLVLDTGTGLYWNGSTWTDTWSWFPPVGIDNWTYDLTLATGNYLVTAWTWDTSDNLGSIVSLNFSVSGN